MIRRIFTILYLLSAVMVGVGIIIIYLSSPLWILVWFFTGWWVYPPASAFAHNIMSWLMVRSSMKSMIDDKPYNIEDYDKLKESVKTQKFSV